MPYSLFLIATLSLIGSTALAVPAKIEPLNKEIKELNKTQLSLNKEIFKLEERLQGFSFNDLKLREQVIDDLKQTEHSIIALIRMQRMPQNALLLADSLRQHERREKLTALTREGLLERIDNSYATFGKILDEYAQKQVLLQELQQKKAELAQQKKELMRKRQQQIAALKLSAEEVKQLNQQSEALTTAHNLKELFSKRNLQKNYLPESAAVYPHLPTQGQVIKGYNSVNNTGTHHRGLTILAGPGAPVKTLKDGRIIYNGPFRHFNWLIIVEHANSMHTLYGNLASSTLKVGNFVEAGDTIGFLPKQIKPELYFELRKAGLPTDPALLLASDKLTPGKTTQ